MEVMMRSGFQKISVFFVVLSFIISSHAHENIKRLIIKTEKEITLVKTIIYKTGNIKVEHILQQAIVHYEAGKMEYFKLHNKRKAEKELKTALNLLEKAKLIAKGVNIQNIDKLVKRLSLKIKNLQRLVHDIKNYKAQDILQKGVEQYNTGIQLLNDNNPEKAYTKLVISAKLIARAESIARDIHTQDTDKMIKRLGIRIQNMEKMLSQSKNQQVKELYDKCIIFYEQGIESKSEGKTTQSLVELNHAQRLITHVEIQVKEILKLIKSMEQTKIKLDHLVKSVEKSQNHRAEIVLTEGINHFTKAKESLDLGKIRIARTEFSITVKLLEKAKSMIND